MKRIFLLGLVSVSCMRCAMTAQQFQEITIGQNIESVEAEIGQPYKIETVANGDKKYIYIERLSVTATKDIFRQYEITVSNGKVIQKSMSETMPSQIEFHD